MHIFTKKFAGQSILSWVFQIILIWIAWGVHDGSLPKNVTTITFAAVVLLLIYWSFSLDRKRSNSK
ncbi:hypothetical protein FEZ41_00570 [Lentilactobacillus parafarraginis]|mgnify:FL=1|jgi:hypothetical protein|uniref:Uncharacterized protein n=3 Tax=Lentilactobacillus parafarraginis TaxID=390842 RepID=A0A0R1YPI9_9LACO|nr:hypothetical protein [Lentilactobacillus parafarraginis]EHM00438.1 hypothetical protein HMPREF9103_00568 [Lentilactobacillus parafarraginis F0439]KRM44173.1 hypothetical protein FD47_GL000761 [Lentilactobacillus parafarraginis DSM 18390 = JCM 14109]TLQ21221.1 hypothetical protein FEZ41_00570 [Lentilactobacillus parafarraginis]